MDLYDSDGASSESSNDAASEEAAGQELLQRSQPTTGRQARLLAFTGQCIGDDMTSVGSRATRFISLQSGGTGGNREHWGHLWATGLKDLGGDIGAVAETRIYTEEGHAAASRGMLAAGYVAISHGVGGNRGLNAAPLTERDELLANGVILAVRRTYAGSWEHVARDGDGRGLAANVVGQDGTVVRVVGLYGVAGGSLPGFDRQHHRVEANKRLLAFLSRQQEMAVHNGWVLVVLGDVNSICDPRLDTWDGTHVVRSTCLACALAEAGLQDTFRTRHPRLRGFTYYALGGSASRLDAVWLLAPAEQPALLLSAAVLWGWIMRADHEPALADLLLTLPTLVETRRATLPIDWRDLLLRMQGQERASLEQHVKRAVDDRRRRFDAMEVSAWELGRVCDPSRVFHVWTLVHV